MERPSPKTYRKPGGSEESDGEATDATKSDNIEFVASGEAVDGRCDMRREWW